MPIPLFSIPEHIRNSIIQKFDFADFLTFHRCSLDSYESAANVKTKFVLSFKGTFTPLQFKNSNGTIGITVGYFNDKYTKEFLDLPVRLEHITVFVMDIFTEEFNMFLKNLLLSTNSSFSRLHFWEITCSWEGIRSLYKTGKIYQMSFNNMEESEFFSLDLPAFDVCKSFMTNIGMNTFLKQLVDGKRNVDFFEIKIRKIQKGVIFDGVPNCLLYSSEIQEDFIIGSRTHRLSIKRQLISIRKFN